MSDRFILQAKLKKGMRLYDRWYSYYGVGVVQEVKKTRVVILFSNVGKMTYDKAHLQFLMAELS